MPSSDKISPEIRAARRELFQKVRSDWSFDDRSEGQAASDNYTAHEPSIGAANVLEWRERTYASSDPSSSEDEGEAAAAEDEKMSNANAQIPTMALSHHHFHHHPVLPLHIKSHDSSQQNPSPPSSPSPRRIHKPHLFARSLLRRSSPPRPRSTSTSPSTSASTRSPTILPPLAATNGHHTSSPCPSPLGPNHPSSATATTPAAGVDPGTSTATDDSIGTGTGSASRSSTSRILIAPPPRRRISYRSARRRKRFADETTWNSGLAHWSRQRDAWTCARHTPLPHSSSSSSSSSLPSSSPLSQEEITQIPLLPPLLPVTDPTRSADGQGTSPPIALYPSIYSKVVLQSLTPSVPINLGTMTSALVQGWIKDGEWPPPSSTPPVIGQSQGVVLQQSGSAGVNVRKRDTKERKRRGSKSSLRKSLAEAGVLIGADFEDSHFHAEYLPLENNSEKRDADVDGGLGMERLKKGVIKKVKRGLRLSLSMGGESQIK